VGSAVHHQGTIEARHVITMVHQGMTGHQEETTDRQEMSMMTMTVDQGEDSLGMIITMAMMITTDHRHVADKHLLYY
jgi:hypothetical protein